MPPKRTTLSSSPSSAAAKAAAASAGAVSSPPASPIAKTTTKRATATKQSTLASFAKAKPKASASASAKAKAAAAAPPLTTAAATPKTTTPATPATPAMPATPATSSPPSSSLPPPTTADALRARLLASVVDDEWRAVLAPEFDKAYCRALLSSLAGEYASGATVYPPLCDVFAALNHTPLAAVRVVILGQDPYHGAGQANGLCFSVARGVKTPPSLGNIFKELERTSPGFRRPARDNADLTAWARQGVLMLNATLTVREAKPNSHEKWGWQQLTDALIATVNRRCANVVFLLWGQFAHKKGAAVDAQRHKVIKCPHPSPLAKGFVGSDCFAQCDKFLAAHGGSVDWRLV